MPEVNGRAIIQHYTNMSARPEFYSGRGARVGDLSSKELEEIYKGLKKEAGDQAAKNFVQFVYDFDKLAATTFLNDFYTFCYLGCDYKPKEHKPIDEIDVGPDREDDSRLAAGMAGIMSFLGGGSETDETETIRGTFLDNHREEFTPDPDREDTRVIDCYGLRYVTKSGRRG